MSAHRFCSCVVTLMLTVVLLAGCQTVPNPRLRTQGKLALERKQLDRAEQKFAQAIQQQPTDWKSQFYLGLVKLEQQRPLDAQVHLEQALAIREWDAETPAILDAVAEALYRQGAYAQLDGFLRETTRVYGHPEDYLRQGQYLTRVGDHDAAEVALNTAARLWPVDDERPYVALADFYDSIGADAKATIALRRAYGINPGNPRLADRLRQHGVVPGPSVVLPPIGDHLDR